MSWTAVPVGDDTVEAQLQRCDPAVLQLYVHDTHADPSQTLPTWLTAG